MNPADARIDPPADVLRRLTAAQAPRATGFIVTIYGDVVEPRGGTLWMGTLIETCAAHGISESLVRTAVSRLVGAGRLEGERIGRKSYYRLTGAAQEEFQNAARILYAPTPAPTGWLVHFGSGEPPAGDAGWARVNAETQVAPNRSDVAVPDGLVMSAEVIRGEAELPAFAAAHWDLAAVRDAYARFIGTYDPVAAALGGAPALEGEEALALRLRLVHRYRHAALADPRLPRSAWPRDWPAEEARRLFVRLYLALADAADRHVGRTFRDSGGLLARETDGTRLRLDWLQREGARWMPPRGGE